MSNEVADKWIQRAAVAAIVAVACGLLGTGVALYAPSSHATPATVTAPQGGPLATTVAR
ncbi:MAG TPA: hypothetical protein VK447_10755 [Myxococcaceae bacterium]|nr:hypothetical protein [Myxococcaceae bacterium]